VRVGITGLARVVHSRQRARHSRFDVCSSRCGRMFARVSCVVVSAEPSLGLGRFVVVGSCRVAKLHESTSTKPAILSTAEPSGRAGV